jgi:hypothetical protein
LLLLLVKSWACDTRGKVVCKASLLGELGMPYTNTANQEGAGSLAGSFVSVVFGFMGFFLVVAHGCLHALNVGRQQQGCGAAEIRGVSCQLHDVFFGVLGCRGGALQASRSS